MHAGLKNLILEKKIDTLEESPEVTDAQANVHLKNKKLIQFH